MAATNRIKDDKHFSTDIFVQHLCHFCTFNFIVVITLALKVGSSFFYDFITTL